MKRQVFLKTKTKVAAAVFAAAMTVSGAAPVISMTVPVMAASPEAVAGVSGKQTEPSNLGKGTITVNGVGTDAKSVKAYKVVTGYYNTDGKLVKYVLMDPTNGAIAAIGNNTKGQTKDNDPDNDTNNNNDIITATELTTIAKNIANGAFDADKGTEMTKGADGTWTTEVTPGLYVIIVTTGDNSTTLYNPAVAAVNITNVNTGAVEGGSVDLNNYFTSTDGTNPSIAYVKKTASSLTKKETGSVKLAKEASEDTAGNTMTVKNSTDGNGDTLAYGDSVSFEISGLTVPSYSEDYTDPYFYVTDELTPADAFTAITNIVVKNGNTTLTGETGTSEETEKWKTSTADYVLTMNDNSKGFKVQLTAEYLKNHRADTTRPQLTITYRTKLSGKADVNFAENQNHAELHYTNEAHPAEGKGEHTEHKDTYIYTFAIDGNLDGQDSTNNKETHEFNKVTKADPSNYVDGTATGNSAGTKDAATKKSQNPLAGATFTLYSDEECKTPVMARTVNATTGEVTTGTDNYTAVSDENGHFSFVGLDEGTYYVKETTAPDGYTLSDAVYKFVIAATLNGNGTLQQYSITTQYKSTSAGIEDWTSAGSATYTTVKEGGESGAVVDKDTGAVTNTISSTVTPMEVVDTKVQNLPFTGGEGRYAIYLTAAALGGAMIVLVGLKKKEDKKEA